MEIKRMTRRITVFDELFDAKVQALASSWFYPNGRHYVVKRGDKYVVEYDGTMVRDGVDESNMLYVAHSHCNSGVSTYRECRDCAEEQIAYEEFQERQRMEQQTRMERFARSQSRKQTVNQAKA